MARAAVILYGVAFALLVRKRWKAARLISTFGLGAYVLHVCGAFEFFYGWSHSIAYRETARQSSELFGVSWGGGLYLNYLFTLVWCFDCVVSWHSPAWRDHPLRGGRAGVHAFLAFMAINGSVVVWILRVIRAG